jgi:hypothetical protein
MRGDCEPMPNQVFQPTPQRTRRWASRSVAEGAMENVWEEHRL